MDKTAISERMENTPIPQLIFKSSVPLMISTLASSMYGLVDSMFVSRISEKALTATTIAFPITLVLYAITIGTAMGVNSRMSRFLGEGEVSDARLLQATGNASLSMAIRHSAQLCFRPDYDIWLARFSDKKNISVHEYQGKCLFLEIEGADHTVRAFADEIELGIHKGGFHGYALRYLIYSAELITLIHCKELYIIKMTVGVSLPINKKKRRDVLYE